MRMGPLDDRRAFAKPNDDGTSHEKKQLIPYSAARDIRGGSLLLRKPMSQRGWVMSVDEDLGKAPADIRNAMYQPGLPGRIPLHLLRLLARKGPEYDFGVALLKHGPEILKENRDVREKINGVVSAEYADTVMWWTFAPYLFQNLISKRVGENEAIQKILDWAQSSSMAEGGYAGMEAFSKLTLAGLEVFNKEGIQRYGLTSEPDDLSHKFTEQEAERIVRDVFGVEEKKAAR